MATKIWYPEKGDLVTLLDGRTGYVHPDWSPVMDVDEDSWKVTVSLEAGHLLRHQVQVIFNSYEGQWEEIGRGN